MIGNPVGGSAGQNAHLEAKSGHRVMGLVERITATLTPELGAHTADAVARHLCAKYGVMDDDSIEAAKLDLLRDFLRRGLVAYVGPERAASLAAAAISAR